MPIPTTPMIERLKDELDELLRENAQIAVALSEQDFMIAYVIKTGTSEEEVNLRAEALDSHIDEKQEHLRLAYLQAGVFELTIKPHGDEQDERVFLEMVKWEPGLNQTMPFKGVLVSQKYYPEYSEQVRQFSHREYHNVLWLILLTDYLDEFDVVLFNGSVFDLSIIQKLQNIPNSADVREAKDHLQQLQDQDDKLHEAADQLDSEGDEYEIEMARSEELSRRIKRSKDYLRSLYLQEGVVEVNVRFHEGFGDGNVLDHYYLCLLRWDEEQEEQVVYAEREVHQTNPIFFGRMQDSGDYSPEMLRHILECSNFLYGVTIILFGGEIYNLNKFREEQQN